ncbi:MAG TPA: acyl-CoA dehydrogenase family protein [Vicinamibacterales bacterium]|jgi:indole-3-acetate monooxygenase|nr:acyl-CoA dehydrogenase family protein [Vicinamibacterales bacterium]
MTLSHTGNTRSPLTAADIINAVRALAPEIQSRGDEIAALRRLPVDLVTRLKAAGVFRVAMPKAWGGPEMTPRAQCEIYEILGAADASVAWCAKIGSDSGYFAAQLDEQAARTLYPDLDFVTAGQVPPNGLGERVDGGYRLSGHWTFGSGCTHADVIGAGFLVTENGKPMIRGGAPQTRIAFAPASHFEIIDTWHSTGLAGSGSNDYRVKDLFVPDAHTLTQDDPPRRSEPLYCYFGMFLASWHGIALGLARRAIDAALVVADKKMHIFPPPPMLLRQRPHARVALAKAEMTWRAARAFTYETTDRIWEEAESQGRVSPDTRRAMALSLQHAFRAARDVAQSMYDLVGPTAVFSAKTPLDRLLRDAITMSEHLLLSDSFLEMVGAGIVGDPPQMGWL